MLVLKRQEISDRRDAHVAVKLLSRNLQQMRIFVAIPNALAGKCSSQSPLTMRSQATIANHVFAARDSP